VRILSRYSEGGVPLTSEIGEEVVEFRIVQEKKEERKERMM